MLGGALDTIVKPPDEHLLGLKGDPDLQRRSRSADDALPGIEGVRQD